MQMRYCCLLAYTYFHPSEFWPQQQRDRSTNKNDERYRSQRRIWIWSKGMCVCTCPIINYLGPNVYTQASVVNTHTRMTSAKYIYKVQRFVSRVEVILAWNVSMSELQERSCTDGDLWINWWYYSKRECYLNFG